MKILIIGGGSIGQRHLRNLNNLGVKEIGVLDIDRRKLKEIRKKYQAEIYQDLDLSLKEKWDAAFVCTPPSSHIKITQRVIEKKIPIFIEKPLSHNLKNIPRLMNKVKKYKIPVMIGYNLRFHPQIQKIKKILKENIFGKVFGVKVEFGQYLPDWHPGEDYRQLYSAQKKLGGGIILDAIHEIDYLYWLFGKIKKLYAFAKKISNLEINTEDYAEIILWFENGIIGQIHLDYLQRDYSRNLKIIGEKGNLEWILKEGKLRYFLAENKKWFTREIKNFDFNQTYLNEIKHFLNCIQSKEIPEPGLDVGYQTLKVALGIKKSAKLKKVINL